MNTHLLSKKDESSHILKRITGGLYAVFCVTILFAGTAFAQQHERVAEIELADGTVISPDEDLSTYKTAGLGVTSEPTVDTGDSLALVAYYQSTNGDFWIDAARGGWLVDPVSFWEGVDRISNVGTDEDPEWRVTRMDFDHVRNSMTIPGPIPPEFASGDRMFYLERFRKRSNELSGNYPQEFETLENLERLRTRSNRLSGEIDWELFVSLPNLERFEIRSNQFEGEVPALIGDFPRLERFDISDMNHHGEIPQELANIETLTRIDFGSNDFTGDLPNLGDLENLTRIEFPSLPGLNPGPYPEWLRNPNVADDLSRLVINNTNRTGPIPDWITELANLNRLDIGGPNDDHVGEIPNLEFMDNLSRLRIYEGDYGGGPIPEWIGRLIDLDRVQIHSAGYTGEIPDNLAGAEIERLEISDMELTGGLPVALSNNTGLIRLEIEDMPTLEVGQIPDWIEELSSLERIRLRDVGVSGTIPDALAVMESLTSLRLDDNPELGGPVPMWLKNTESITDLNLSDTSIEIDEVPAWLAGWDHAVSSISLSGLRLSGEIPAFLGEMTFLSSLDLSDNNLRGGIPAGLADAPSLSDLDLSDNQLSGDIPWGALTDLPVFEDLDLSGNFFEGRIPPIVGTFPRLQSLDLSGNEFEGQFPHEIANIASLQELDISSSGFTGEMPNVGDMPNLEEYDVSGNQFEEGPIPTWLQSANMLRSLETLDIRNTNRTGQVPDWFTYFIAMEDLSFGGEGDDLTGEVPDLSVLDLESLEIGYIDYEGPFPAWIANMENLEDLSLSHIGFTGSIPSDLATENLESLELDSLLGLSGGLPDLSAATNLERLSLEGMPDLEVGDIPTWIADFTFLDRLYLRNVGVTGTIPDELGALELLEDLRVDNNPELGGEIPDWVVEHELFENLYLGYTSIELDEIPSWLADKEFLEGLHLAGLGLTGDIPDWIGDFQYLMRVYLDNNELTGNIPVSLANVENMRTLSLENNQLEGSFPNELADMGRLKPDLTLVRTLRLNGNEELEGEFPSRLADARFMERMEFDGTQLCGPEGDEDFENWLTVTIMETNKYRVNPPAEISVRANNEFCGTAVSGEPAGTQYIFRLRDNYPNPFNPATKIAYEVPENTNVTLEVYNVLGQRVATLVNETQDAGRYEVSFDATNLASGTYIYRLEAADRVQTRTMMFVK